MLFRSLGFVGVIVFVPACFAPHDDAATDGGGSSTAEGTFTDSSASETTSSSTTPGDSTTADASTSSSSSSSEDDTSSATTGSGDSSGSGSGSGSSGESSTGEPARCDPNGAFGEPEPLDAVNSDAEEHFGWMTDDELSIYFDSTRSGVGARDIYVATRDFVDEDFGEPVLVGGVNTPGFEDAPRLTDDGLVMFGSQWDGVNWNVVAATRADVDEDFGAFEFVPTVNGDNYDADSYPVPSGSLYFTSDRLGSGDIFYARWSGIDFDPPEALEGVDLSTASYDGAAVMSDDELTLYFISNRPGGAGAADIYVARRESIDDPFDAAEVVEELATDIDEIVTWVSSDGCAMLLDRPTPAGDTDILLTFRER